jgi:hypothetical protein
VCIFAMHHGRTFVGKRVFQKAIYIGLGLAALMLPGVTRAQTLVTYGQTTVVKPGGGSNPSAFELTSNSAGAGYAGVADVITSGVLTPDQLTTLRADYNMTTGSFGGGAPRFSIGDTTNNANNEAYVYWGTPTGGGSFSNPNAGNVWANIGNYADATSSDMRVEVNGFGGINQPNTDVTWSQFLAEAGTVDIGFVSIDLDAGTFVNAPDGQQMLVNDFMVNNQVFNPGVPDPAVWSMLTLGVAGIGSALRLRPKRLAPT